MSVTSFPGSAAFLLLSQPTPHKKASCQEATCPATVVMNISKHMQGMLGVKDKGMVDLKNTSTF